jgi:class 3 adenylate cyclase
MKNEALGQARLFSPEGVEYPLSHGTNSIGRAANNQWVLEDTKVSRNHAIIHSQNHGQFMVVDLGSANGSYLNGRRITSPACLKDGDSLRFGNTLCVFKHEQNRKAIQPVGPTAEVQTIKDIIIAQRWILIADIEGATAILQERSVEEVSVQWGKWFSSSKSLVEEYGGAVNSFLGDGFMATWLDSAEEEAERIGTVLRLFKASQERADPRFRIIVHYGPVHSGTTPDGAEGLMGPQVNFAFRMEKIAARLKLGRMASKDAVEHFGKTLAFQTLDEDCSVPGFQGKFRFSTYYHRAS